jgi:hypothetical protein
MTENKEFVLELEFEEAGSPQKLALHTRKIKNRLAQSKLYWLPLGTMACIALRRVAIKFVRAKSCGVFLIPARLTVEAEFLRPAEDLSIGMSTKCSCE